jgi:predicted nucleic acid-binding protein
MTVVLDTFAVVALLTGEPAAPMVWRLLDTDHCVMTAVGVAEVADRLVRVFGGDVEDVALDIAALGLLDPPPLHPATGFAAGVLRATQYHGRRRAVSLADCVAARVAYETGSRLATADPHLIDLCGEIDVDVVVLPDSGGATYRP